jgi:hypothetical protein
MLQFRVSREASIKVSIFRTKEYTRRLNLNGEVQFGGLKNPEPLSEGRMSKFVNKVKNAVSFRSSRSRSSSCAGSDMEVDPSSPTVRSSSRSALEETFTLLRDKQIKLQDDREKKIFRELKTENSLTLPFSTQHSYK